MQFQWTHILVIAVSLPLAFIFIAALYYSLRSLHHRHPAESIYECSVCGHVYTFARNRPMDRCPRCGNLNEAVRT